MEAARSELAAAQREAEVLRAGAGADKDSALAALKVLYTCVLVLSLQACKVSLTAMEERFCLCSFLRAPAMAKSSM